MILKVYKRLGLTCPGRHGSKRKECGAFGTENKMLRWILKAANSVINFIVIVCLFAAGIYAAYALWDNSRIYAAVSDVQADMIKLKPDIDKDGRASFEELMAINSDVCAWITLDNTQIDYPILQGSTNLTYINHDVYGNFALAGSIYLDARNKRDFSDKYSLLYGHHMANSKMFGDLDLYKDQTFFDNNSSGILILPDKTYKLEIFACLLAEAGEENIFDPEKWQDGIDGLLSYVRENKLHIRESAIENLSQMDEPKVLALSTCATEFTDARTIILAVMEPYQAADQEES